MIVIEVITTLMALAGCFLMFTWLLRFFHSEYFEPIMTVVIIGGAIGICTLYGGCSTIGIQKEFAAREEITAFGHGQHYQFKFYPK